MTRTIIGIMAGLLIMACGGGNGNEDGPSSPSDHGIRPYAEYSCSQAAMQNWTSLPGSITWGDHLRKAEAHRAHQANYDGPLSAAFRKDFHEPWIKVLGQMVEILRTQDANAPYDETRFQELTSGIDEVESIFSVQFGETCQEVIASWGGGPG